MEELQVGDVVMLRSGGEAMTIEEIEGDDIKCIWFNGSEVKTSYFKRVTLKKKDNSSLKPYYGS